MLLASAAKFHNAATRFGDQQMLALADAGHPKEIYELLDARNKSMQLASKANEAITLDSVKSAAWAAAKKSFPPSGDKTMDAVNLSAIAHQIYTGEEKIGTPEHMITGRIMMEGQLKNKSASEIADDVAEALKKLPAKRSAGGSPLVADRHAYIEKARQEIRDNQGREPTADEERQLLKQATEKFGDRKIDQAIVNEVKDNYPGMKEDDLGFIPTTQQPRLKAAFESADRLEKIAAYAKENPDAIGLIADSSRKMNLDAYQGLVQDPKNLTTLKERTEKDADAAIDSAAKEHGLDLSTAAKAKVLQKMLTTQSFADAASAGSRGGTIYLDKAFREIYDQSSSPGAFFSILEKRYDDANRETSEYHLPLDKRAEVKEMPFWQQKASGYVSELGSPPKSAKSEKPPRPDARKGLDDKGQPGWFIVDPDRPGKYLQVKPTAPISH